MAYEIIDSALPWTTTSAVAIGAGGGLFLVARSFSANVAVSNDDGRTWSLFARPSASQASQFAYGNGVFVLVTGSSTVHVSPDGETWVSRSMPTTGDWTSVTFGNGVFVAVQAAGRSAWSVDGETWAFGAPIFSPTSGWSYVGFNGSLFVTNDATDSGTQDEYVYTTPDGATWTNQFATLQVPADVYHSSSSQGVLYTNNVGITKAVGASPTWEYAAFAVGETLPGTGAYSVTAYFNGQYINCEKPSATRFRLSNNIVNAEYLDAGNSYTPSNNKSLAAVGATAALFVVSDASANKRILGLAVDPAPIPPTQFWEALTGTSQY